MEFERIDKVLEMYLTKTTNYALLLTGGWGVGKTYYLKNRFFNHAETIKTTNSGATRRYKPIIVSLFGVKTIDDIKDRIFIELYPILDNKYLKTSKTILKTIVKSIDITQLIGRGILSSAVDKISDGVAEIREQKSDYIDLDNLIICFDDLERIAPEHLSGDEVLGFINSLVENANIKVIVVANDDKITSEKFKEVKEKTIGNIVHFNPEFIDIFEGIICSSGQTIKYEKYLRQNGEIIYEILQKEWKNGLGINFRTVQYFISNFSDIYYKIEKGVGISALEKNKDEILLMLLKFSLIISIEYRKGQISYINKERLDDGMGYAVSKLLWDNNTRPSDSFLDRFIEKYYPEKNYHYFNSIYNYITGGDGFNYDRLKEEIKIIYNVKGDDIPENYRIYNQLLRHDFLTIDDKENKRLVRKLLEYTDQGLYATHEFTTLYFLIIRNGNVLRLNPQKLCKRLVSVLRRSRNKHVYHPLIDKYLSSDPEGEFSEEINLIKDEIVKLNELSYLNLERTNVQEINTLLKSDFELLFKRIINELYTQSPTFTSLKDQSPNLFYSAFRNGSNSQKFKIIQLFYIRYIDKFDFRVINELHFLTCLKAKVDNKIGAIAPVNNSGILYFKFQNVLNQSVNELLRRR